MGIWKFGLGDFKVWEVMGVGGWKGKVDFLDGNACYPNVHDTECLNI